MRIFLMCGAFVGITGTLIGTDHRRGVLPQHRGHPALQWRRSPAAAVFNPAVFMLTHLPDTVDWHDVMQVVMLALVLSLLATLYPSWRAARTDPVEALRHE